MRLFVAIDCEAQRDYFKRLQSTFPEGSAELKNADSFHLTLKFLGKVPETELGRISGALRQITFTPFTFSIGKIGFFPNANYVRIAWAGVIPQEGVIGLQKKVESALKAISSEEAFVPHITLARIKKLIDRKAFFDSVLHSEYGEDIQIEVTGFKLMKSALTQHGPVYTAIEEFKCLQE